MDDKLAKDLEKLPFEKALERLEGVVDKMESGDLSLDDMISSFEEGSALSNICGKKLKAVEKRIQILLKEEENNDEWGDFEPEPDRNTIEESDDE